MVDTQTRIRDSNEETIELHLSLTGNPWTDMGIVGLCQELRDSSPTFLEEPPVWMEHEITISVYNDAESMAEMAEWFYDMMRTRWNQLFWPSKPAKVLGRSLVYKGGFVDSSEQLPLLPGDKELVKETLKTKGILTSSIKDTAQLTRDRLNYVGTPSDRNKVREQIGDVVRDFVKNWMVPDGTKLCDLCGCASDRLKPATQSMNPLMNKYHNNRVRGSTKTSGYYQWCPVCHFTNLCASLDANLPFVYDRSNKQTLLILPDIADLELLERVQGNLSANLRDLSEPSELYTSTNLRGYWWHDTYSLALVLLHNVFYRFSIREDSGEEEWSFEPTVSRKKVSRWLIVPFTRNPTTKNVRFGNIHAVQVDDRLYNYIKPIPMDEDVQSLQLVPDILSHITPRSRHPKGIVIVQSLSKAIATSDVSLLNKAVFLLWKHDDAINFYAKRILLPRFIQHFLEVNAVLNDELREDLRAIGITIGSAFSRDVTLISKLYNVSSEGAFRAVIKQVLFRLYKLSISGKLTKDGKLKVEAQGETREITRVKTDRFTRVIDQLSEQTWKEMAETLSTFASLSAFNANFSKSTN